jgi:hypothetical protein
MDRSTMRRPIFKQKKIFANLGLGLSYSTLRPQPSSLVTP